MLLHFRKKISVTPGKRRGGKIPRTWIFTGTPQKTRKKRKKAFGFSCGFFDTNRSILSIPRNERKEKAQREKKSIKKPFFSLFPHWTVPEREEPPLFLDLVSSGKDL